jgi:cobalt/nickel transport system ATP-binding protein
MTPDPEDTNPAIRVSGLTYRYPDGKEALRGVELIVPSGQSVALVGPNGAGKSTLLLHLNGLLPGKGRGGLGHAHAGGRDGHDRRPTGGPRIWIEGIGVSERTAGDVRRRVGLVFQDPDDQLFCNTVLDDVAFGPLNQGKGRSEARAIAMECLAKVELSALADRPPHHLSFGERKRACLAGVLACEPSVLVLDEPSANLDPRARRRFIQVLRELSCTKLIATHDLELVLEVCPRTVVLDQGQVAAQGESHAILGDAALMEAHGLEQPMSLKRASGAAPQSSFGLPSGPTLR